MPSDLQPFDISDELIGSVLGLSCSSDVQVISRQDKPRSRFNSPLATAQYLDMWGSLNYIEAHRLAIVQLVKLRGGLAALGSAHLALVVQL